VDVFLKFIKNCIFGHTPKKVTKNISWKKFFLRFDSLNIDIYTKIWYCLNFSDFFFFPSKYVNGKFGANMQILNQFMR